MKTRKNSRAGISSKEEQSSENSNSNENPNLNKSFINNSEEMVGPSLQRTFHAMQMIIFSKGGMVRQLLVDDKGLVAIIAFGVNQVSFLN